MNSSAFATIIFVLIMFLAVNWATYFVWKWDKSCAQRGAWRFPERYMLGLALLGGSPAAFYASHRLRHKTRKEPFRTALKLVVVMQIIGVIVLCSPQVRPVLVMLLNGV